jgi:hypothetical protein
LLRTIHPGNRHAPADCAAGAASCAGRPGATAGRCWPQMQMFLLTSAQVHDMRRWTPEPTCRLCGRGSFRRRLARRDSGKMLAARVATHRGSPVSSRPQSHVLDPSVATWTAVKNHNCWKHGMRAEIAPNMHIRSFWATEILPHIPHDLRAAAKPSQPCKGIQQRAYHSAVLFNASSGS